MTKDEIKERCHRGTFVGDDGKVYEIYDIDLCIELMQHQIDQEREDGELLAYNCEKRARQEVTDKAVKCFEEFLHVRCTCDAETTKEIMKREREAWLKDFRYCMLDTNTST